MNDARSRPRQTWAWSLVAAVVAALVLALAPPAAAHAALVDTDPDEGAVLESAPDVIRLTFNEAVQGVPGGVQVFDAAGEEIASSSHTRDADLLVTLDEEVGDGSLVVAWRVVSVDGHPIAGTLTFAIGAPSPTVDAPVFDASATDVPLALSLTRWPAYAGLLLAVGLVWFAGLVLPPTLDRLDRVRRRLRSTARTAAVVAAVAWLVGLPLTALYVRGTGPSTLADAATWQALPAEEAVLTAASVVALVAAVATLPARATDDNRPVLAALAGFVALVPLPLSGHTRAAAQTELVVAVDGLHLVAGAAWLGGLVGLALTVPALAGRHDAMAGLVSRFSAVAASALGTVVLAGAFLAWRLVGSWSELFASDYGRVLLVKIALVALAVAVAAYNRVSLVPRIRGAAGFHDRAAAARTLARTASTEASLLLAVLLVTGFLVNNNPPSGPQAGTPPTSQTARTTLGDLQAVVTLDPATSGMNTVTVRIRDGAGPADGSARPRVRITSGNLGGSVPLERVGPGSFQGRVVIPRDGIWEVQVSLRLSRFENPVASVEFHVGAH